jgi:hypothetical protein
MSRSIEGLPDAKTRVWEGVLARSLPIGIVLFVAM